MRISIWSLPQKSSKQKQAMTSYFDLFLPFIIHVYFQIHEQCEFPLGPYPKKTASRKKQWPPTQNNFPHQKQKTSLQIHCAKTNSTAFFDAGKRKRTQNKIAVNLETYSYQIWNRENEFGNNNEGRTAARNAKQKIYRNSMRQNQFRFIFRFWK